MHVCTCAHASICLFLLLVSTLHFDWQESLDTSKKVTAASTHSRAWLVCRRVYVFRHLRAGSVDGYWYRILSYYTLHLHFDSNHYFRCFDQGIPLFFPSSLQVIIQWFISERQMKQCDESRCERTHLKFETVDREDTREQCGIKLNGYREEKPGLHRLWSSFIPHGTGRCKINSSYEERLSDDAGNPFQL